jgi:glycerate 2-kinase
MASALGIAFYDENGEELLMQGDSLNQIRSMDVTGLDHRLKHMRIEAACDVTNPLVGHLGASAVFGPQKGATPEMVAYLDMGLNQLGDVIQEFMNLNVKNILGAGAAGGLGAGVIAFFNGRLKNGIETVLDIVNFESVSQDADLVITGEGRIDSQTIQGKAPIGVAKRAKQYNIPVIGLAGSLGIGYERIYEYGIDAVFSIVNGVSTLDEALLHGKENVEITSENIARSLKLKKVLKKV